jgi:hypothetical protein
MWRYENIWIMIIFLFNLNNFFNLLILKIIKILMKEEVRIVGIISERDIEGRISLKDLRKIIFECL